MRVLFALARVGGVDADIDSDTPPVSEVAAVLLGQLAALLVAQLAGQGKHDFPGRRGLRVLVMHLDAAPKSGPLGGAATGQDQPGRQHAPLAGVVVDFAGALIDHFASSAIRSGGRGGTPGAAANRLHAEVVDRHSIGSRPPAGSSGRRARNPLGLL